MDERWHHAVRLLQAGVFSDLEADELLAALSEVLAADAVVVTQQWAGFATSRSQGIPEGWPQAYAGLQHQDPSHAALASRPAGSWFFINEESGEALRSELYRTFRDQGFHDGAIARFDAPPGQMFVVFYRKQHATTRDFDRSDRALLALLSPHLARGFRCRVAVAAWQGTLAADRHDALAQLPHVLLTCRDRSVSVSPLAKELMQPLLAGVSQNKLDLLLWRAAQSGRECALVGGIRAEPFFRRGDNGQLKEILLMLSDAPAPSLSPDPLTPAEELLSPRQRLVARLIASGRTVDEAAALLDSKPATVRQHLKTVYDRLKVSDRTGLCRLVHM